MRYFAIVGYWCVAALVLALTFVSFDFAFGRALFMASLFLPALLCIRLMLPQVSFHNRWEGLRDASFIIAGAIILTILLLLLANINDAVYQQINLPVVMTNPIFTALLLIAVAAPQIWIEHKLDKRAKQTPQPIDFISDRRRISLVMDDITYVESNDSEVWVHTLAGESYRTKTTITQWVSILDNGDFVRIHRAYLVNRRHITTTEGAMLTVAGESLPISRKYRETVRYIVEQMVTP